MRQLVEAMGVWETSCMTQPSLPIPHEQRKVEQLLIALAKKRPISAKPAPIAYSQSATGTANRSVFFST